MKRALLFVGFALWFFACFFFLVSRGSADQIRIQVVISADTEVGQFSDALYYPIEEWPVSQERIDSDRDARVTEWVDFIKNTPPNDPVEGVCSDGLDDDADGLTDCADSDCAGIEPCP